MASEFLSENTSIAVGKCPKCSDASALLTASPDNTNADAETRAVWVELAKRFKVPIRCIHFTAPTKLCEHNDTVRALSDSVFNPEKRNVLPRSAFASFASKLKEPKMKEGFQDISRIEFQVRGLMVHGP